MLLFTVENLNAILGWVAIMLVARRMGAGTLGELGYALSLVGGFTFIAFMGYRMAHVKRVSEGMDLGKCTGTFLAVRVGLLALMLLAFGFAYWVWTGLLGKQLYDIQTEGMLGTILAYYVVFLLTGVMVATFTGRQEGARVAVPNLLGTSLRSLLMIFAAGSGLGAIWLARSYLLGALVIGFASLWYFRDYPVSRPDRATFRSYSTYALPVAITSIFAVLRTHLDKLLIGIFWAAEDVGLYFGVQRIALFIGALALSLEGMLLPSVSQLHARGGTQAAARSIIRAERYTALVAIPIVLLTVIWAEEVILVFISREFLPAARVLQLLVLVALARILNRPWSIALRGADMPALTTRVNLATGTLSVLLMLLLVPREIPQLGLDDLPGMGGEGAALALLGPELLAGVWLRWYCYRELALPPSRQVLRQLAAALLVAALFWQLDPLLAVERWFELFGLAALGGLLYYSLLAVIGGLKWADIHFAWDVLNPGAMGRYLRDELRR